jgi:hypothetical protein
MSLTFPKGDDLLITVCDLVQEELSVPATLHWSIPDPVSVGTATAFDSAFEEARGPVRALMPQLAS